MTRVNKILLVLGSLVFAALFIKTWQAVADARLISPVFLPGPDRAWAALLRGLRSGELFIDILETVYRMTLGWFLASVIGVALGALIGVSRWARAYFGLMLEFLRPLPASAIMPVAIALFGLSEGMVLGVVAFGAIWPMLLATVQGFSTVEPRLFEVGRLLGLGRLAVIGKIALPSALPDILSGMRVGITVALILTIVGEMLSSQPGLGLRILLAARAYNAADLYAGVMVLGLIGIASSLLIDGLESLWKRR